MRRVSITTLTNPKCTQFILFDDFFIVHFKWIIYAILQIMETLHSKWIFQLFPMDLERIHNTCYSICICVRYFVSFAIEEWSKEIKFIFFVYLHLFFFFKYGPCGCGCIDRGSDISINGLYNLPGSIPGGNSDNGESRPNTAKSKGENYLQISNIYKWFHRTSHSFEVNEKKERKIQNRSICSEWKRSI